ncbi:TPA: hypothetical protein N2965_004576 [Vibrio parahaemolyticus]|nr:hypothetical protein [Vibrio parahaemolyticus]
MLKLPGKGFYVAFSDVNDAIVVQSVFKPIQTTNVKGVGSITQIDYSLQYYVQIARALGYQI